MSKLRICFIVAVAFAVLLPFQSPDRATAQPAAKKAKKEARQKKAKRREPEATGLRIGDNKATPVDRIRIADGFKVELIYSVPAHEQGSWVNLCVDDRGRILASDQYGGLYRFTPPPPGKSLDPGAIEKMAVDIRAVNGMAWAFGALYVGVNDYEDVIPSGLYRLTDSDGDDTLDKVELLRAMETRGDHGVHAVVPTPDGKALFLITGNNTKPTQYSSTRVPPHWGEDHLLPRMPDGRGFMRDTLAPGGIIYRVSPDGKDFEVYSSGYRNIFDAALNREGELFTYDADMEYDFNTSWYRPTRVNHVVSGSEYGWRNGAGKWPEFYPDSLPAVLNIGPGSPTGTTFGYGGRFPAKYQNALFILDWSWGKMYAVHLEPNGASYTATKEEFMSGAPLPLTDAVIHSRDGAMYFAIGGRKVQSGVYRVTYVGEESTEAVAIDPAPSASRELRHQLEQFHHPGGGQKAIVAAWPHLNHEDRFIRSAARTVIEHQAPELWADKALGEADPGRQLEALLGLTRATGIDPQHRQPNDPPVDHAMAAKILDALLKLDWSSLTDDQRITLVRTYEICFNRFGPPPPEVAARVLAQLDPHFPSSGGRARALNWLLCETLVYLDSPHVAAEAMALIEAAPTQEEQIEYARSLRMLDTGWDLPTRTAYFEWLLKAANYRGGASFEKFIEFIRNDALATLSEAEKVALKDLLERKPVHKSPLENLGDFFVGRTLTNWTLEELSAAAKTGMKDRNYESGRMTFGAAACFTCHRFGNEGGMTGPDLTGAGGRYTPHDLLDQIINPSKEINEQFVPIMITKNNGEAISGVIVNLKGDNVTVNTDPADPNQRVSVDRKDIARIEPSKVSPMPPGLLNMLRKEEVLDLLAYILSAGDPNHAMFR